jgi:hypothetical protein
VGHPPSEAPGGGWPPVSPSASCPARQARTWRQVAARLFSFLPAKGQGKDVLPLQLMEMRLFVKGRISMEQEAVKVSSSPSLSPSPPPRTPSTKPGRALYGLDFADRDGGKGRVWFCPHTPAPSPHTRHPAAGGLLADRRCCSAVVLLRWDRVGECSCVPASAPAPAAGNNPSFRSFRFFELPT